MCSIAEALTAFAALATATIAFMGLHSWRREMLGRRKSELAEKVLSEFYEARDLIRWVRFPGAFKGEGSTREPTNDETDEETRTLNALYVPIERLNSKAKFFSSFEARRYRFAAVFGKDAAKHFDTIINCHNKIGRAAGALIRSRRDQMRGRAPISDKTRERFEEWIGWGLDEQDEFQHELDAAVAAIEKIYRPAIEGSV